MLSNCAFHLSPVRKIPHSLIGPAKLLGDGSQLAGG